MKLFTPVCALNEVESLICVDNGMDSNFGRSNINKEFPGDYQIKKASINQQSMLKNRNIFFFKPAKKTV